MRLLRVEVRRLVARALVLVALLAGLAGAGLWIVGAVLSTQPMTEQQRADAERFYQQELASWEEHGEEQVADCLEQQAAEREASGDETIDYGCDQMEPQREWFFFEPPPLDETLPGLQSSAALLVVFVALVVGVTATAAELSTGTMSTWLTFVPRRLRVFTSKVVAPAVVAVPVALLLMGLHLAGTWLVYDVRGLADGMTSAAWGDAFAAVGRTVALAAVTGALGAALGLLLRRTAVVLGVLVVYAIVVEGMLRWSLQGLQPLLASLNLQAFIQDGADYWMQTCTVEATGTMCESVTRTHSLGAAGLYLGVVTAVVLLVAALDFRRRDI